MSVLFIVPSLARAGAETQLVSILKSLPGAGGKVHLVCFDADITLLKQLDPERVVFHHFKRRFAYDIDVARSIASLIEREQINVVHCTLMIALFFGWFAARLARRRVRVCVAVHTTKNRDRRAEIFDWLLYHWLMMSCAKVIFVCEEQRRHWIRKWPLLRRNSTVIHNGIDAEYFSLTPDLRQQAQEMREALGIPPGQRVIAHVAAFRPEKGHRALLDAVVKLSGLSNEFCVVMAGDGILRLEIQHEAERLGVDKKLHFVGNLADVRPLLVMADVSVITSTAETFSMAMLESMAMETPVVAFDVGGTREAVRPEQTGWLVAPGDIAGIATTLAAALDNNEKRHAYAQAGRTMIAEQFTLKRMALDTARLLDEIEASVCVGPRD